MIYDAIITFCLTEIFSSRKGREEAARRIYVATDAERGTFRAMARREGDETFTITADVGGRYKECAVSCQAGYRIIKISKGVDKNSFNDKT